jgi:hypothetical protein
VALHQLVYVSAASVPFGAAELAALLSKARANNQRLGVGGMLIHHQGSFMQTLEGEEHVVKSLFERIERDQRHHRVLMLSRQEAPRRAFGDWSMGYVDSELAMGEVPGFNDFFRRGFEKIDVAPSASQAKLLFQAFREGRFRQFVVT